MSTKSMLNRCSLQVVVAAASAASPTILAAARLSIAVVSVASASIERTASAQTVTGWGLVGLSNADDIRHVLEVSAGMAHVVARLENGRVACWGDDSFGQCDVPSLAAAATKVVAGGRHTVSVLANGQVRCWGSNENGQCNPPFNLNAPLAIAAGYKHNAAIRSDSTIVCWGFNRWGQCTVPATAQFGVAIAAGKYHTIALRSNGSVSCWGLNSDHQCNPPPSLGPVAKIACVAHRGGHFAQRRAPGRRRCLVLGIEPRRRVDRAAAPRARAGNRRGLLAHRGSAE